MRALQLKSFQSDPELVDLPEPEPGPGQVVVKVGGAGACHSDLHVMREFADGIDSEAIIRIGVLWLLYSKRRANPDYAALSLLDMENIMAFPRERLLFALWYLRAKRYVLQDDRSSFIIAAEGVDYLESQLPTNQILYKIFRDTESGVMVYPKALTSKTS